MVQCSPGLAQKTCPHCRVPAFSLLVPAGWTSPRSASSTLLLLTPIYLHAPTGTTSLNQGREVFTFPAILTIWGYFRGKMPSGFYSPQRKFQKSQGRIGVCPQMEMKGNVCLIDILQSWVTVYICHHHSAAVPSFLWHHPWRNREKCGMAQEWQCVEG